METARLFASLPAAVMRKRQMTLPAKVGNTTQSCTATLERTLFSTIYFDVVGAPPPGHSAEHAFPSYAVSHGAPAGLPAQSDKQGRHHCRLVSCHVPLHAGRVPSSSTKNGCAVVCRLLADWFGWRAGVAVYPPMLRDKVAIVTGANTGLGLETTKALLQVCCGSFWVQCCCCCCVLLSTHHICFCCLQLQQGATVIMACRSMVSEPKTARGNALRQQCASARAVADLEPQRCLTRLHSTWQLRQLQLCSVLCTWQAAPLQATAA